MIQGRCVECMRPSAFLIHWPRRGEGPYFMCPGCAWHSVGNRGAVVAGMEHLVPKDISALYAGMAEGETG